MGRTVVPGDTRDNKRQEKNQPRFQVGGLEKVPSVKIIKGDGKGLIRRNKAQ